MVKYLYLFKKWNKILFIYFILECDNLFFKTSTIFSQDKLKTLFNKFSNNSFNMDVKQVRLALKELFNDFEVASDDTLLVIYIIINN